ncbi:antibiotic biosynthesis monooxygenase [Mycena crocata]|nr:antibiotic biosynthesis monooxygenase [Mycena crocata]
MDIERPHYAVIFTSKRRVYEGDGYGEMAVKMETLARAQPGFLGSDSVSSFTEDASADDGSSFQVRSAITVSYWEDESSIQAWKRNLDHLIAQKKGKNDWYLRYEVRVTRVERAYAGGVETNAT